MKTITDFCNNTINCITTVLGLAIIIGGSFTVFTYHMNMFNLVWVVLSGIALVYFKKRSMRELIHEIVDAVGSKSINKVPLKK